MSTRLKEKQEKIQHTLNELVDESAKGTLIVVEGKKDVDALRDFGVAGPILAVKAGGKSFADTMNEIEQKHLKEVVLLLDFDRRGREATERFKQCLERARIKLNLRFWQELSALLGREIQCIESLTSYMQTLEHKTAQ